MREERFADLTRSPVGRNRGRLALTVGAVLVCGGLWSVAWTTAQETAEPVGLAGLLPAETPTRLNDTLTALPENWQAWGESLGTDLAAFYETPAADIAGQRAALDKLKSKWQVVQTALADPRYRKIRTQLQSLSSGLARRVAVYEAVLDTLEMNPDTAKASAKAAAQKKLVAAVNNAEQYLSPLPNGRGWISYLKLNGVVENVRDNSADGVAAVSAVQQRFSNKEKWPADGEQARLLQRPQLVALESAVDDYVSAASREVTVDAGALRTSLAALLTNLDTYEATATSASAQAVRDAFAQVRASAPDGGARISEVLQLNYFYYNTHIAVSEDFISKMLNDRRTESGGVRDFVLGADVSGSQTTTTDAGVELLPSSNGARFNITLNGTVVSNTAGVTRQATIYTYGQHQFRATKEVHFDGQQFATRPALISVWPSNTAVGASTRASRIPLLGRVADNYAIRAANDRRPESEAIAANRVTTRVTPKFNEEVDKVFNEANRDFDKKVTGPLKELELYPDSYVYRTSADRLDMMSRLMATGEMGGAKPEETVTPTRGVVIRLHETALNNSLDRLDIAGKTMTEEELRALLEERLSRLFGRDVNLQPPAKPADSEEPADEEEPKALIFAEQDPIRILAGNGELTIVLRAGFKREGADDIPTQVVTVPLRFTVTNTKLIVRRGDVSIASLDKPANVAEQIARAGVIRKTIEKSLPERETDRKTTVKRDNGKQIPLYVTQIKAVDGWLTIVLE